MTNYPVSYDDEFDFAFIAGYAATAEEAINDFDVDGWRAVSAELSSSETGRVHKRRDEALDIYADEIASGYCQIIQVWGGWKAEITYWVVDQEEVDG